MKIEFNISITALLVLLPLLSCGNRVPSKKVSGELLTEDTVSYVVDKEVFQTTTKYTYYDENGSIDSVISRYNDTGSIEYISYYMKKNPQTRYYEYPSDTIHKSYYRNGSMQLFRLYAEAPKKEDIFEIYFFETGEIQMKHTFFKDSLDYPQVWTTFYQNGNVQRKGIMDHYKTWLVPFGLWEEYNENGQLTKTVFYHNAEPEKAYMLIKQFDSAGKVISEQIFNNYILYEDEPKELNEKP